MDLLNDLIIDYDDIESESELKIKFDKNELMNLLSQVDDLHDKLNIDYDSINLNDFYFFDYESYCDELPKSFFTYINEELN